MDQTMMRLPSSPHGNPVEMQCRLTFHLVNNVSLTIWSCLLAPEIALTAAPLETRSSPIGVVHVNLLCPSNDSPGQHDCDRSL